MRHLADEGGKSKDQCYSPTEVSRVIVKVIGFYGGGPGAGARALARRGTGLTLST